MVMVYAAYQAKWMNVENVMEMVSQIMNVTVLAMQMTVPVFVVVLVYQILMATVVPQAKWMNVVLVMDLDIIIMDVVMMRLATKLRQIVMMNVVAMLLLMIMVLNV